jgi:rRNA maturation endonuclease Nob1
MNHNEYFVGLRTCLKDDDPLAFPQVKIRSGTVTLPLKPIKPSISGTMPALPGKSQAVADLSFAAATVADTAATAVDKVASKVVVHDRTHTTLTESLSHPILEPAINAGPVDAAAGGVSSGSVTSDPQIIQTVLGTRPGMASDMYTQFKRIFPHGRICQACNKPLQAITSNCQACGTPTRLEFKRIKHILVGNQQADWLEAALSSTRLKFIMLYLLLIAGTFYLGHKKIVPADQLVAPFMVAFMLLYFWRMIALFWRRYFTIRSRRKQYLKNSPEVVQEVKEALWKSRYDPRMTPTELEMVQGFNVFSDIRNETMLFFIGDRRY